MKEPSTNPIREAIHSTRSSLLESMDSCNELINSLRDVGANRQIFILTRAKRHILDALENVAEIDES